MILDNQSIFSDQQAITASAASTNILDMGVMGKTSYNNQTLVRRLGVGTDIPLLIQVTENFNNATSITIEIQTSTDAAFTSPVVVQSSGAIPLASLKAGHISKLDRLPRDTKNRYIRIYYTVTGTAPTTGKITAGFTTAVDGAYRG